MIAQDLAQLVKDTIIADGYTLLEPYNVYDDCLPDREYRGETVAEIDKIDDNRIDYVNGYGHEIQIGVYVRSALQETAINVGDYVNNAIKNKLDLWYNNNTIKSYYIDSSEVLPDESNLDIGGNYCRSTVYYVYTNTKPY